MGGSPVEDDKRKRSGGILDLQYWGRSSDADGD
jgi:hypothetical protein